ncbi:MAG: hypothetical protein JOZ07_09475 [Solirubrobacterales bacterium]|nr:hypothetical protein [Solirubrobacterales bacterium]
MRKLAPSAHTTRARALRRAVTLTGVLAAVAVATPITATAAAAAPCPNTFGSISAAGPAGCFRPYAGNSVFNRQIPTNPALAPNSRAIISTMAANHVGFEGGRSAFAFTTGDGRDGIYYSQPSDPTVTVHCTYEWGPGTCAGPGNNVSIDGKQIHIPAGARPQDDGSDQHMTIIDQSAGLEYDFEHATWSPDHKTIDVWSGAEVPIGPDSGTGLGSEATAADFATLAGLITEPELASGTINHALSISVPCTTGSVYPASGSNGFDCSKITAYSNHGNSPALGQLLQLNMSDAQIADSHAPAWQKTIMTAMAHYGLYINDTNGNGGDDIISLEAESDISYTSLGGQPLMANYVKNHGGTYYSPLSRWILSGPELNITDFRVLSPCVAQGACSGTGAPQAGVASVHHKRTRSTGHRKGHKAHRRGRR